ncbi:hypothetical protein Tco_1042378 [Tanacetum coccineum]|uniref:Uncharacterized protein n=1 Tax=Tanacetum coccineum TaxID=301880 RepID=A0ABQ5GLJ6_9ASTR
MKVEESFNVTFDESPPPTKLSPLVDDDVGEEEAIENNTKVVNNSNEEDESIEVDEVINIKESKNHPLEKVIDMAPLPHRDLRHPWLRYQVKGYDEGIIHSYEQGFRDDIGMMGRQFLLVTHEGLFEIREPLLGGAMRRMTWRQFILALGLHTEEEMVEAGFGAYWQGSERVILDKGDLRDYWMEISFDKDFLGPAPSYVFIQDPVRRLCHKMIACNISGRGQAPEKVTGVDLFYLRSMDRGTANVPYLLAQYLFRHAEGRKSGARLSEGYFIGRLAAHFGLPAAGGPGAAEDAPIVDECAQADSSTNTSPQPHHPLLTHRTMTTEEREARGGESANHEASGRTLSAYDSTLSVAHGSPTRGCQTRQAIPAPP